MKVLIIGADGYMGWPLVCQLAVQEDVTNLILLDNCITREKVELIGSNSITPIRSFQERAAINAPIQGSAADIIRLAMIKVDNVLGAKDKAKMLLQIHDELIFECPKKDENSIKKLIKELMVSVSSSEHHMFSIPLEVSINSGNNWGEAH